MDKEYSYDSNVDHGNVQLWHDEQKLVDTWNSIRGQVLEISYDFEYSNFKQVDNKKNRVIIEYAISSDDINHADYLGASYYPDPRNVNGSVHVCKYFYVPLIKIDHVDEGVIFNQLNDDCHAKITNVKVQTVNSGFFNRLEQTSNAYQIRTPNQYHEIANSITIVGLGGYETNENFTYRVTVNNTSKKPVYAMIKQYSWTTGKVVKTQKSTSLQPGQEGTLVVKDTIQDDIDHIRVVVYCEDSTSIQVKGECVYTNDDPETWVRSLNDN